MAMHLAIQAGMPLKQSLFPINATYLRIPAGGRLVVGYLQSMTEDLNSGLPRNKSRQRQGGGLEPGTSGLQHLRPKPLGHSAFSS